MCSKTASKVLVYVQAVPILGSQKVRRFEEFSKAFFRISHSSISAFFRSKELFNESMLIVVGYSSVLAHAMTLGASSGVPVSLCDDPLEQALEIKNAIGHPRSIDSIVVGENLDGPFSGASLAGALSVVLDLGLAIEPTDGSLGTVVLLKDDGIKSYNMDIRRIDRASSVDFAQSLAIGNVMIEQAEGVHSQVLRGLPSSEISTSISRKLRRLKVRES